MALIIKWRTGRSNASIEKVECTRETEKCVWLTRWEGCKPSRMDKRSTYYNFHDSWEDAKAFLLEDAQRRVESARRSLEFANSFLGNVKGLRKPEGE